MKATFALGDAAHQREALGDDDLPDSELAQVVAELWSVPSVTLLDSRAETVDYDVPSILTGARTWVRGHADDGGGGGPRAFTLFVKRVHSWRHSPAFAFVSPEIAEWAAASVPWRAEQLLYASDLADRLPEGLSMTRALRIEEHPDETAVLWLEAVECEPVPWTYDDTVHAARLLGRLSASPRVAPLAGIDPQDWNIQAFVRGRIAHTVLPYLHDDETWGHPAVAAHFGDLRGGLTAVAGRLDALAEEFDATVHLTSHGDACPNNLLRRTGDPGFILIDFAFWRPQPVGFDLSQLLVGDIQIGRQAVDDLPQRADACVEAYVAGLADEGVDLPLEHVRRAHAVSFMLFNGLPSLPTERLHDEEAVADHWSRQRSGIARYALDVLARTEPT